MALDDVHRAALYTSWPATLSTEASACSVSPGFTKGRSPSQHCWVSAGYRSTADLHYVSERVCFLALPYPLGTDVLLLKDGDYHGSKAQLQV